MSNANSVLLVVFFIFGVIVIGALYDWNFDPPVEKEVTNVVTYEGMSIKMSVTYVLLITLKMK